MWIKTNIGGWICGDKVCHIDSVNYSDGDSDLSVQLVNGKPLKLMCSNKEEAEYIKEELAKAFIEDNRRVFDVESELWAFRKAKEGGKID